MSWEEMSVDKHPCPCGKGTYSVTHRMDDWNRSDSSMQMDCEECRVTFVLFSESQNRGGIPHTVQFWISKATEVEYGHMRATAVSDRTKAKELRTQRYLPRWKALFEGKNKKQAWGILTNNGERYPALGTFYLHTKEEGLVEYIERHFKDADERAFNEILKLLGVEDVEVAGLMERAATTEQEAHDLVWQKRFL